MPAHSRAGPGLGPPSWHRRCSTPWSSKVPADAAVSAVASPSPMTTGAHLPIGTRRVDSRSPPVVGRQCAVAASATTVLPRIIVGECNRYTWWAVDAVIQGGIMACAGSRKRSRCGVLTSARYTASSKSYRAFRAVQNRRCTSPTTLSSSSSSQDEIELWWWGAPIRDRPAMLLPDQRPCRP